MSESPSGRATRRRHAGGSDQGEEPVGFLGSKLLGLRGQGWTPRAPVTSSPLVEHLALSAFDTFVAGCSLCVLALLRPSWFQEVSDDVQADEVGLPKPSVMYVSLLALICGCGGVTAKVMVMIWCLNERGLTPAASVSQGTSVGGYEGVRLRVVGSLFVYWIFVVTAVFHLLGAPLECLSSSFLLSIFFATVGVAAPYASAVAEACRSARWDAARATEEEQLNQETSGQPVVTSPSGNASPLTRGIVSIVEIALSFLLLLLLPVFSSFANRYARAYPVLQELMLGPGLDRQQSPRAASPIPKH
ncbi:hypothetical protein Emag_004418 [Eimeria magna]